MGQSPEGAKLIVHSGQTAVHWKLLALVEMLQQLLQVERLMHLLHS